LDTPPNWNHQRSDLAETLSASSTLVTSSDVNAPTVITLDSPVTSPPSSTSPVTAAPPSVSTPHVDASPLAKPQPDLAESAPTVPSNITLPQTPKAAAVELPKPSKGKTGLIIGLVALMVVLGLVAVAGFAIYTQLKPKTQEATKNAGPVNPGNALSE